MQVNYYNDELTLRRTTPTTRRSDSALLFIVFAIGLTGLVYIMHQRIISAEDQTQRVNQIIQKMEEIQQLDFDTLIKRPAPDRWSIIEVVGHMNSAYRLYRERLDQHIPNLPDLEETSDTFQAGRKNAWFINMITPQGQKRPYKIKTTKF